MRYIIFPDVLCFSIFIIAWACLKESRSCCTFSCSTLNDVQKDILASYNVVYTVQWGHWYGQNAPNYVDKQNFFMASGFRTIEVQYLDKQELSFKISKRNNSKKLYIRRMKDILFIPQKYVLRKIYRFVDVRRKFVWASCTNLSFKLKFRRYVWSRSASVIRVFFRICSQRSEQDSTWDFN